MATRADSKYTTDLLEAPNYARPVRDYILDGLAVAFVLVLASVCGCLVADHVQGKIAHHCAVELQKAVQ
jgi:hypothetical protein